MILIDALHINNGGGKVLLDYLISELEKTESEIYYLLDERIIGLTPIIKPTNTIQFLRASLKNRYYFYLKNRKMFTSILCFGNLPPYIKINSKVYTYFHQPMYITIPNDFNSFERTILKIKTLILYKIKKNTDIWIVQSSLMKKEISKKYKLKEDSVYVLPFYSTLSENNNNNVERIKHTFIYVSNATPNKNHKRLIDAFCDFYDKDKRGVLTLTVSEQFPEIKNIIDKKHQEGYPIKNIGFVDRVRLTQLYQCTEFLIFPSLAESFGLGIVEAIENGCKVIGADLPYMHAVCIPSITFNPYDYKSISRAFEMSFNETKESLSLIQNKIDRLIKLIS